MGLACRRKGAVHCSGYERISFPTSTSSVPAWPSVVSGTRRCFVTLSIEHLSNRSFVIKVSPSVQISIFYIFQILLYFFCSGKAFCITIIEFSTFVGRFQ